VQLAGWKDEFAALDVAVAGMTYDDTEVLAAFHAEHDLGYPLLRDVDVKHVEAFGIRNEDYGPGHQGYGIPHPGILWLSADGVVRGKWAVPGYRERPPFETVHAEIRAALGGD
jgi:peroxiredoxin Q/BCP